MKIFFSLWFALACVFPHGSVAAADFSFRVSGYGKIFYVPDRFDLTFSVITEDVSVGPCKDRHMLILNAVKTFLDRQGKSMVSLRQDATTLDRAYLPSPERRVFRYVTTFTARLRDAIVLLPFQEGLITAGVTDLHGLDLFSSRQTEWQEDARREAIKDARRKAELAAKELGWKLSHATDITFSEESWRKTSASANHGSRITVAKPETPADLTTYADCGVTIVYRFEPTAPGGTR